MVDERRIAILGAGRIGEALIRGLLSSGWREPGDIRASTRREERVAELNERHGIAATLSNAEAVAGAALVVIAVKPQDIDALLGEVGPLIQPEQTVLTIAAAIPTAAIERHLAESVPVVRAMPNTPSTVHEGIAGVCAGAHADEAHLTLAEDALAHLGAVVARLRAVHGRGDGGLRLRARVLRAPGRGDDRGRDPARPGARGRDAARRPDDARDREAAPRREDAPGRAPRDGHLAGGTTIAAIRELEQAGVRAAFLNAIQAAMERSKRARPRRRRVTVDIRVVEDPAREAAELLAARGVAGAHMALSGGSGARSRTSSLRGSQPDWGDVHVWFGDERVVPPTTSARTTGSPGDASRPPRRAARRASHPRRARPAGGGGAVRRGARAA